MLDSCTVSTKEKHERGLNILDSDLSIYDKSSMNKTFNIWVRTVMLIPFLIADLCNIIFPFL